ncbi:MAG TPA: hypothetical protein VEI02_12235 [Planctomycetota bacterium]|nr:hypothetical protein [Planctomycetota bacterium]
MPFTRSAAPAALLALALAVAAPAPAQIVDAFLPDADATTGVAANSIPFNPNFGAQPGAFTQLAVVSAAQLAARGVPAGAQLVDVKLAPCGSGTLAMTQFRARVGHLPSPTPSPMIDGVMTSTASLYDSDASGPFTWTVVGGGWNSLGLGGGGFVWDGASDVGVYTSHSGLSVTAPSGWPGTFWRSGTAMRLYAAGFAAPQAEVYSASALKMALVFASGPAVFASATPYGAGTPGISGTPQTYTGGAPSFSNANFGVGVSAAAPGALAFLAWSSAAADVQVGAPGYDVRLLVDLGGGATWGLFPALVDAQGSAAVPLPLGPFDPAALGARFFVQWFVLDPAGRPSAYGASLASTEGLELKVGV